MNKKILEIAANFEGVKPISAQPMGNGHINDTYLIKAEDDSRQYVMQRINPNVFKNAKAVMDNAMRVTEHIRKKIVARGGDECRECVNFLRTESGKNYVVTDEGYWRMYIFIDCAVSPEQAENAEQMEQAGFAFGRFAKDLSDFDAKSLVETIPDFHNTPKRFADFENSVKNDAKGRRSEVEEEIAFIMDRKNDCSKVTNAIKSNLVPIRVTHNDTKLNNILLDSKDSRPLAIIDLDTVMPGSALYDFGDAIRFAGNTAVEDEKDLSKVHIALDFFEGFAKGYLRGTNGSLTETEIKLLPFSAKLMTLECAMRFLGDYLDGDTYFRIKYDTHNLVRARTQLRLVAEIEKHMDEMEKAVEKLI